MQYNIVYKKTGDVWYAMKASYGKALKAKEVLDSMGVENFVPMYYKKVKKNGRNHFVPTVAIPNLIFIKADTTKLEASKRRIDYLHNILVKSTEHKDVLEPMVVPEIDMDRFVTVVTNAQEQVKFVDLAINQAIISKGTRVRIVDGRYEGYEGILCRPKGSRSKRVLIDLCGLLPVEIPAVDIELLEKI